MSVEYATELVLTHVVPGVWQMACYYQGERVSSWRTVDDYYSATWSPSDFDGFFNGVLVWDGRDEMIIFAVPRSVKTSASTICVSLPSANPNELVERRLLMAGDHERTDSWGRVPGPGGGTEDQWAW